MTKKIRILFMAHFASELSNTLVIFVLSVILYQQTGSALIISYLWICYVTASIISHIIMGPIIDKVNRKYVMLLSEWGRALVFIVLLLLFYYGYVNTLIIISSAFFVGFLEPLFHPSCLSYISKMVKRENLKKINSRLEIIAQIGTIAGPGIGGVLVSMTNEYYTLGFMILMLIISGVFVSMLPDNSSDVEVQKKWIEDLIVGWRFFIDQKILVWLGVLILTVNTAFGAIQPLFLPYINEVLNKGDFEYGLTNTVIACGMITGSLIVSIKFLKNKTRIAMLSSLALSGMTFILMGLNDIFYLFLTGTFFNGVFVSIFNINNTYLYQTLIPHNLVGRVFAIRGLVAITGLPIGAFIGGILTELIQINLVFIIMGLTIIIPSILFLFLNPLFNINELDIPKGEKG